MNLPSRKSSLWLTEIQTSVSIFLTFTFASVFAVSAFTGCGVSSGEKSNPHRIHLMDSDGLPQPDIDIPSVPNNLYFRKAISPTQVDAMGEAISALYVNPPSNTSDDAVQLKRILHSPSLDPALLQSWMEARVKYVVDSDFELAYPNIAPSSQPYAYPQPGEIPPEWRALMDGGSSIGSKKELSPLAYYAGAGSHSKGRGQNSSEPLVGSQDRNQLQNPGAANAEKGVVIMSNLSPGVYLSGKTSRSPFLYNLYFEEHQPVPVTSPRTGILKVGEGLFMDYGTKIQNIALDIFRLSVLFHEARHSDGNGETLGFLHAVCPESFDLKGMHACDLATNGPYMVGARLMRTMMTSCTQCTNLSKRFLEMMYADVSSRLILDESPDVHVSAKAAMGQDWDDRPEGQR